MKKYFDLSSNQLEIWESLVQKALLISNYIELNPLYKDQNYTDFLKDLSDYMVIPSSKTDGKFYSGRERVRIPISVSNINDDLKVKMENYKFWQNHYLENPSFWIAEKEVLASISHENMVMADIDHFGEILENLDLKLYDVKS